MQSFLSWCEAHNIIAPKISFLPITANGEAMLPLSQPNRSTEQLREHLAAQGIKVQDTATREELLKRLPLHERGVREMTTDELRSELKARKVNSSGRPLELMARLGDIYREEHYRKQLKGHPVRFQLFARVALEQEGVYASLPTRLVLCKGSVLKSHTGLALKLPWPKWTRSNSPFRRQAYLNYQFEELFCLALFLVSQQRLPSSMWKPWLSVVAELPVPRNVFLMSEADLEALKGSHVLEDIQFVQELSRSWFEVYVNEPHVVAELGGKVDWSEFSSACALVVSRAQVVPQLDSFQEAQFGVVPFADFLGQGRNFEDVQDAQIVGEETEAGVEAGLPAANLALSEAEDSLELRQAMREALGLAPEKREEQEESVFLTATRDVAAGGALNLDMNEYQDNAGLLLTHGIVLQEDATTFKLPLKMDDEACLQENCDSIGPELHRKMVQEIMRKAAHFTDVKSSGDSLLPDILWTFPSPPRALSLLTQSIFPFVCLYSKNFSSDIARAKIKAALEAKLATYNNNDNHNDDNHNDDNHNDDNHNDDNHNNDQQQQQQQQHHQRTLVKWEQNLVRYYLSAVEGLSFDPHSFAAGLGDPLQEPDREELSEGEEELDECEDEEQQLARELQDFKDRFGQQH